MTAFAKRKVRRSHHRRAPSASLGVRVFAPIVGQDPRDLHAFVLIDQGEPLLVPDPEQDVYLREV
jgi:hypothetical protein